MKVTIYKPALALFPLILSGCTAKEEPRPNILIAIGDDISWPHMGAYGCTFVRTPGFDRVARGGVLFSHAYTPNAKSGPSRACLLTGRNSWQLKEACNHWAYFPAEFSTFFESLSLAGYRTGYTAKGWAPGIALDSAGKPRELTGKAYSRIKCKSPTTGISNVDYSANFSEFLDSGDQNKPFCFWYGSTEPHRKYEFGSGISKGGKKLTDAGKPYKFWPENDTVQTDILDYAFEIEYFDYHLVKMLEILEKRGELENTIVIVTADNGMPFPRIKGQAYEYSNHMPLAIMWGKGIKNPGRTADDYISFIDFAPTILEAARIRPEDCGMQPIEGKSFLDIMYSGRKGIVDKQRDHVLIGKERHDVGRPDDEGYPVRGIVKDGFICLKNFKPDRWPTGNPETGYLNVDGSPTKSLILSMNRKNKAGNLWQLNFGKRKGEELYDIINDPECIKNLSGNPVYSTIMQKLAGQLVKELTEQQDPRILGNGDIFDGYVYADKSGVDFYNRYIKGKLKKSDAGWVDTTDFEKRGFLSE